ncbi:MAG: hypothetical protein ACYDD1_11230 [Caulobacteraceae bacterium]
MIAAHRSTPRTAAQAGAVAIASLVAAHAWRRLLTGETPTYAERVMPAAWRLSATRAQIG